MNWPVLQIWTYPDHTRIRTLDCRNRISGRCRKIRKHGYSYGTRKHRQTASDDDGYEDNRSRFYFLLRPASCRRNPKRGIKDKIHLKKGIIGSERWGEKMRRRITEELGIELYDIYGLTEIYGPGIGISCSHDCGYATTGMTSIFII